MARTAAGTRPAARPAGRSIARRYLPPQHGAWAMLLLPFAVGVACAGPVPLHLVLLVAWICGYLLSYWALLAVKTGRPGRVAGPLRLYAAGCLPAAVVVAVAVPAVWWFAPVFAALLAVNAGYARRRDDRALPAGLASVVQSCLMVPLAVVVAGRPIERGVLPALVLLAYFTGSLLYVKTMIRHRGERAYRVASVAVHAVATVAVTAVAWPIGALFGWLTVRAAWLPGRDLTPLQVGLLEAVHCMVLLVAVPLLLR